MRLVERLSRVPNSGPSVDFRRRPSRNLKSCAISPAAITENAKSVNFQYKEGGGLATTAAADRLIHSRSHVFETTFPRGIRGQHSVWYVTAFARCCRYQPLMHRAGLSEEQITDIFSSAGKVERFRLVYDTETGRPKGFGFADYPDTGASHRHIASISPILTLGHRQRRICRAESKRLRDHGSQASRRLF